MSESTNERKERLVKECKILMPPSFIINCGDDRIAAFIDMVIGDVNWWPPYTGYDITSLPASYEVIVKYGTQVFTMLFLQATYTLQDFDWNDSGLSLRLDRVSKIDQSYKNILDMYKSMALNAKKHELMAIGGRGLSTPRYQSQIGQFLKIALGGSFVWNMV